MATLPGIKFYASLGYEGGTPIQHDLGSGLVMELVPMRKDTSPLGSSPEGQ